MCYTTQKNDEQGKQTDNKGIDESKLKKNQMKKSILLREQKKETW